MRMPPESLKVLKKKCKIPQKDDASLIISYLKRLKAQTQWKITHQYEASHIISAFFIILGRK